MGSSLKYRLIGHNIGYEKIKDYLEAEESATDWEKEYITLREIKTIFLNHPFNLKEEEAMLLGRYIIEDDSEVKVSSDNIYVYCHEDNELSRIMAQSILKAFINRYEVPNHE